MGGERLPVCACFQAISEVAPLDGSDGDSGEQQVCDVSLGQYFIDQLDKEHRGLGGLALDETGFATLTEIVAGLADELCKGKLVICLEGGYNKDATAASVAATVRKMI